MMDNRLEEARLIINEVDGKIADLWVRRMKAVEMVIQYKIDHQLPIFNEQRELEVIEKNVALISDEVLKSYYKKFIQETMDISKQYQQTFLIEE